MGTRGDSWGPEGTRGDSWGLVGTRGDPRGPEFFFFISFNNTAEEVVLKVNAFLVSDWWSLSGPVVGHQGHLCILIGDRLFLFFPLSPPVPPPPPPPLILSDDLLASLFSCYSCCFCCCFFLSAEPLIRRSAPLMTRKNTITNACFSCAYLMETAEQITYLWIIRSGGGGGGGMMPLAMQTGTRVPSAPASVLQEGPGGPAGRGDACYHQQYRRTALLTRQSTQLSTSTRRSRCVDSATSQLPVNTL